MKSRFSFRFSTNKPIFHHFPDDKHRRYDFKDTPVYYRPASPLLERQHIDPLTHVKLREACSSLCGQIKRKGSVSQSSRRDLQISSAENKTTGSGSFGSRLHGREAIDKPSCWDDILTAAPPRTKVDGLPKEDGHDSKLEVDRSKINEPNQALDDTNDDFLLGQEPPPLGRTQSLLSPGPPLKSQTLSDSSSLSKTTSHDETLQRKYLDSLMSQDMANNHQLDDSYAIIDAETEAMNIPDSRRLDVTRRGSIWSTGQKSVASANINDAQECPKPPPDVMTPDQSEGKVDVIELCPPHINCRHSASFPIYPPIKLEDGVVHTDQAAVGLAFSGGDDASSFNENGIERARTAEEDDHQRHMALQKLVMERMGLEPVNLNSGRPKSAPRLSGRILSIVKHPSEADATITNIPTPAVADSNIADKFQDTSKITFVSPVQDPDQSPQRVHHILKKLTRFGLSKKKPASNRKHRNTVDLGKILDPT